MTTDDFLEQIREGQVQEEALKKHLGGYRTKDVDDYIEKLLNRLHSMEDIYKERYEEMRTNLFGITKQRDEQQERANALEQIIKDTPKYCDSYLEKKGLIALSKEELDRVQSIETNLRQEIGSLNEKYLQLKKENEKLVKELNQKQIVNTEAEANTKKIEQLQNEIKIKYEEYMQMEIKLHDVIESEQQLKDTLQAMDEQTRKQEEELSKQQTRFEALDQQYKLTQEMNDQLIKEKERQKEDVIKQQESFDNERRSIIRRYQETLYNQQECLKRLQESFSSSLRYIKNLSETEINEYLNFKQTNE